MLVEVSHIGIRCCGRAQGKTYVIGIFRAVSDGDFAVLCPWCKNVVLVSGHALVNPARYPEEGGLRYKDVSHRYTGK